jgi:hypothetical protein
MKYSRKSEIQFQNCRDISGSNEEVEIMVLHNAIPPEQHLGDALLFYLDELNLLFPTG